MSVDLAKVRERHIRTHYIGTTPQCGQCGGACDAIQLAEEVERLQAIEGESKRRAEARRQEIKRTRKGFRKCEAERDRLRDENKQLHDEFERERSDATRLCAEVVERLRNQDTVARALVGPLVEDIRAENAKLAEEVEVRVGRHRASQEESTELLTEHRKQGEEKEKLVGALGFYAYRDNWMHSVAVWDGGHTLYISGLVKQDRGKIARAALPPNPTETATEGGDESG